MPDRSEERITVLSVSSVSCLARLTTAPPAGDGSDESLRFSDDILFWCFTEKAALGFAWLPKFGQFENPLAAEAEACHFVRLCL